MIKTESVRPKSTRRKQKADMKGELCWDGWKSYFTLGEPASLKLTYLLSL